MKISSRKAREKEQHLTEILGAAEKIFATKGFHKTTIQDIAKEAEFSVGYLYNFFKSKEDLYKCLVLKKSNKLVTIIKDAYKSRDNAKNKIINIINSLLSYFENDKNFFNIYVRETRGQTWNLKQFLKQNFVKRQREGQKLIIDIFKDGIKQNIFINGSPLDFMLAMTGILNAFITFWIENDVDSTIHDKAMVIQQLLFQGIVRKELK